MTESEILDEIKDLKERKEIFIKTMDTLKKIIGDYNDMHHYKNLSEEVEFRLNMRLKKLRIQLAELRGE